MFIANRNLFQDITFTRWLPITFHLLFSIPKRDAELALDTTNFSALVVLANNNNVIDSII